MVRLQELQSRGVPLATTDRNAAEFEQRLIKSFGWDAVAAQREVDRVLETLILVPARDYEHARGAADKRLHEGGKSDWPALAAALSLDAEIWTDDVDFFGVGVPVWSTPNVAFAQNGT